MAQALAAAWIDPDDDVDEGNLLGAVHVACERVDRALDEVVEGAGHADAAIAAGRRTGLLIVPALDQVVGGLPRAAGLFQRAREEGFRLLALDFGADSAAASGELIAGFLGRLAATGGPGLDGPTPPVALRRRVAGGRREEIFRRSGLLHVEAYEAALACAGVDLAAAEHVLEWGAGPGRMTAHLPARAPRARITAVDTDREAIAWLRERPGVHALPIDLLPPTTLPDDAFDVVIGHSVLSHLAEPAQDAWLAELARVTRPRGHVAVSFNGPACLTWHLEHPLADVPRTVAETLEAAGIALWGEDGWEQEFHSGYHTTFHRHDYIRERWSRWFDVVAIHERAALPTQDIAVLRGRAAL